MKLDAVRIFSIFIALNAMNMTELRSQFGGSNLFEYQLGEIPGVDSSFLSSHYDQLNLSYDYKNFRASLRGEQFINKFSDRRYSKITQYSLRYRTKNLTLKAGNIYEIIGTGLLLRAYEIPGTVYEDRGYRVREGFYQDLQGFSARYAGKKFHAAVIRGMPLYNVLPPTTDENDRRTDLVEAVTAGYSLAGQTAELNFMRDGRELGDVDLASISLSGSLPAGFSYTTELARDLEHSLSDFGTDSRYAGYFSLNYTALRIGGSLELKSYHKFVLGSAFNDPPTLVKEHSYKVLNRSTHVPILDDEKGYQLEMYYRFSSGSMVTFNTAFAANDLFKTYLFREYFTELYTPLGNETNARLFLDYAQDQFQGDKGRVAGGGKAERLLNNGWSAELEAEYQVVRSTTASNDPFNNTVVSLSASKSARVSGGLVFEVSTDPNLTDDTGTLAVETDPRFWLGANFSYKINRNNTIYLFGGQRRGGPACTSGICYEVLDFTGLEVRVSTKF